ncbi:hypothetical protein LXL04_027661 [Taraxacum kok-saghyz]
MSLTLMIKEFVPRLKEDNFLSIRNSITLSTESEEEAHNKLGGDFGSVVLVFAYYLDKIGKPFWEQVITKRLRRSKRGSEKEDAGFAVITCSEASHLIRFMVACFIEADFQRYLYLKVIPECLMHFPFRLAIQPDRGIGLDGFLQLTYMIDRISEKF